MQLLRHSCHSNNPWTPLGIFRSYSCTPSRCPYNDTTIIPLFSLDWVKSEKYWQLTSGGLRSTLRTRKCTRWRGSWFHTVWATAVVSKREVVETRRTGFMFKMMNRFFWIDYWSLPVFISFLLTFPVSKSRWRLKGKQFGDRPSNHNVAWGVLVKSLQSVVVM